MEAAMLNMSVANACIRGSLFDLDEPPSIPGRADAVHTLQLHQLPLQMLLLQLPKQKLNQLLMTANTSPLSLL